MEYRKFVPIAAKILGSQKVYTEAGCRLWRSRRKKWSAEQLLQAFANLPNEPGQWKIRNNGRRELSWWLEKDSRIEDMLTLHLKGGSAPKIVSI